MIYLNPLLSVNAGPSSLAVEPGGVNEFGRGVGLLRVGGDGDLGGGGEGKLVGSGGDSGGGTSALAAGGDRDFGGTGVLIIGGDGDLGRGISRDNIGDIMSPGEPFKFSLLGEIGVGTKVSCLVKA